MGIGPGSGRFGPNRHRGAGAVEMAIASVFMVTLLIACIDVARWLLTWNAAAEATRMGARLAAICAPGASTQTLIRSRMRALLPWMGAAEAVQVIRFDYLDAEGRSSPTCGVDDCRMASVWLEGYAVRPLTGWWSNGGLAIPPSRATVSRESMEVTKGVCGA